MARASIWNKKFDRNDEFVVRRGFVLNGSAMNSGDAIDKSQLSDRRLRQLYDTRRVEIDDTPRMTPAVIVRKTPKRAVRVNA